MKYTYVNILNKETNTNPVIVHANGRSKIPGKPFADSWPEIIKQYKNSNPEKKLLRDDLTIVTWKGGKYTEILTDLEMSCQKFGVELLILPWPTHINSFWEASKAKAYETLNAIKDGRIKTKYLMAMDAGDVIFLRHPNDILDLFLKTYPEYKSVWCTEANDWPRFDLPKYVHHPILDNLLTKISKKDKEEIENHKSRFAFINAGCVIGETSSMINFYETGLNICGKIATNDQAMARIAQYLDPKNHGKDDTCKIFQCLYDAGLETIQVETVNG